MADRRQAFIANPRAAPPLAGWADSRSWTVDCGFNSLKGGSTARIWRNYALSITLVALFTFSWAMQTWMGWTEFVAKQEQHGQQAQAFGDDGYVWRWGQATFENWQSEFLQVFVFVVLTTFLVHRKSHESPDTDYDTEAALRRIEAKVDGLMAERGK